MLTLRLPEKMEKDLEYLAQKTHRSKSYYVKMGLAEILEREMDILEATAAYEEFLRSGEKAIPWEEVKRQAGLTDDE